MLSHTGAFTHTNACTNAFKHTSIYNHMHRSYTYIFCTQLLHKGPLEPSRALTHNSGLLHADASTHRKLKRKEELKHRSSERQMLIQVRKSSGVINLDLTAVFDD